MPLRLAAVAWGFAEATLFFVVPDVLVSYVALKKIPAALLACGLATAGALVGGSAMYAWGALDPAGAVRTLDRVPAVSPAMIARVERDLEARGLSTLVVGAFIGTPYKIYAVKSAELGISFPLFLLVSVPARLLRYVVVTLLVGGISRSALRGWPERRKRGLLTVSWILFYAAFLTLMPN